MQKLSWIYFYHQRRIKSGEVCDHEEIGLQIFKLINWLRSDLLKSKDQNLLSESTMQLAEISDEELRLYGLLESLETLNNSSSSTINSFHEIGWIDPLPKLSMA